MHQKAGEPARLTSDRGHRDAGGGKAAAHTPAADEEREVLNKETHQRFFVKCHALHTEEGDGRWKL